MTDTADRPRLLLVEDDEVIGEATKLNLERHEYEVAWCTDGLTAWRYFTDAQQHRPYDVLLCDVMLPELDGITLCRRVRDVANTPLLMISARTDSLDVVNGLEAGADDYLTKPFNLQELLARLRSVARRAQTPPDETPDTGSGAPVERYGDLELDRRALELRRDGKVLNLTPTEMRLFLELAAEPGTVVSRSRLLSQVWDYPEWEDDAHLVNVHVQRLRAKIGNDTIETVRGFGYKLPG